MTFLDGRSRKASPDTPPPSTGQCPMCGGRCWNYDPEGDTVPCGHCDATGHVTNAGRLVPVQVEYLACSGPDVVDVGRQPLNVFVGRLLADFPEAGDLAVWCVDDDTACDGPRLVAVIRPGRDGRPAAAYL